MESVFHVGPKLQFNETKPDDRKSHRYPVENEAQQAELPSAANTAKLAWLIVDEDWW